MKFRVIEDCRDAWPVQALCRVLGVSTAGYYAWRCRPESKRAAADRALLTDIRQAHADSGGRYGSPRVHAALRAYDRKAGRGRVERLMRRHGIRGLITKRRRVQTTDSRHPFPVAPNLLDRRFSATNRPNEVWLADLTYIATGEGWLYMAAIMDLHTRKIIGWNGPHRTGAMGTPSCVTISGLSWRQRRYGWPSSASGRALAWFITRTGASNTPAATTRGPSAKPALRPP